MRRKSSMLYKCLTFVLTAVLLHISLGTALAITPQIIAKLVTTGGSIKVNGINLPSGSSIVSGATIETPDNVTATIQIGGLGIVELQAGTIASIEFQSGSIKVLLKKGCANLKTNKGTSGEIYDEKGNSEKTNRDNRSTLCFLVPPSGSSAAGTGAGAGLSGGAIAAIIAGVAGGAVIIGIVGTRGGNNSPSRP